jgi:hypothetical protein
VFPKTINGLEQDETQGNDSKEPEAVGLLLCQINSILSVLSSNSELQIREM